MRRISETWNRMRLLQLEQQVQAVESGENMEERGGPVTIPKVRKLCRLWRLWGEEDKTCKNGTVWELWS